MPRRCRLKITILVQTQISSAYIVYSTIVVLVIIDSWTKLKYAHLFFSSTSITTCLTLQLHARSEMLPRKHLDMKKISHSSHLRERTPRNEQLTRPFQSPGTKQCWKRRVSEESDLIDNTK